MLSSARAGEAPQAERPSARAVAARKRGRKGLVIMPSSPVIRGAWIVVCARPAENYFNQHVILTPPEADKHCGYLGVGADGAEQQSGASAAISVCRGGARP